VIVAKFYDVESGRNRIETRGTGTAHEQFDIPIPRDGGIADLLAEATRPDRRFVAVVCESIERIARVTYFSTKIEYELEQAGVALLAADEGIDTSAIPGLNESDAPFRRATPTLTRRVKQAIAEWYVLNMLELSWGGLKAHTGQGYNIGKPPYGYLAEKLRHPVKAKAHEGKTKHRLVPDPVRGPVVTQIFLWRAVNRLSYHEIARRLNRDPDRYPAARPDPRRRPPPHRRLDHQQRPRGSRQPQAHRLHGVEPAQAWPPGTWGQGQGQPAQRLGVVTPTHPRAPGHPRNLRRGRHRRPLPARITLRPRHQPASRYPAQLPAALVRALRPVQPTRLGLHHQGVHVLPVQAERQQPRPPALVQRPPARGHDRRGPTHPAAGAFFAQRVFGASRKTYLTAATASSTTRSDSQLATRTAKLAAEIEDLSRRQQNLINELERLQPSGDPDVDEAWRHGIQHRFASTVAEQRKKRELLAELHREQQAPTRPDITVLDDIPHCDIDITRLPDDQQRRIYDAFHLELRYNTVRNEATIRVTVTSGTAPALAAAVGKSGYPHRPNRPETGTDAPIPDRRVWDVCGAPPGTRIPNREKRARQAQVRLPGRIRNRTVPAKTGA
jgi:site-specific DNA recombinase